MAAGTSWLRVGYEPRTTRRGTRRPIVDRIERVRVHYALITLIVWWTSASRPVVLRTALRVKLRPRDTNGWQKRLDSNPSSRLAVSRYARSNDRPSS